MIQTRTLAALGTLALAATLAAPAAMAQTSGWFVGGSLGRADSDPSSNVAGVNTSNESTGGYKLLGGYQLTPNWAVEAQYLGLGKGKFDAPGFGNIVFKTRTVSLAAVGSLPLANNFSLLGKLGVAHHRFNQDWTDLTTGTSGSDKSSRTKAFVGIGAEYRFTPTLSLRAEYEHFGKVKVYEDTSVNEVGHARPSLLSIGLRAQF